MSSQTADSVDAKLDQKVSEASATLVSSFSALEDGTTPFSLVTISGVPTTSSATIDITGASTLTSASYSMQQTLVAASGATTFTVKGWVRVAVTDSAGNLADGNYYIQLGELT
jgi:hypothetical protein